MYYNISGFIHWSESESCSVVSVSVWPHGLYSSWNSPGQNTGVGSHCLLQGIFPAQESNPGLLHYRCSLYQLSHQGSPRILEWVVFPFSRGSSRPRMELGSPSLQADSLPSWATREYYLAIKRIKYWHMLQHE